MKDKVEGRDDSENHPESHPSPVHTAARVCALPEPGFAYMATCTYIPSWSFVKMMLRHALAADGELCFLFLFLFLLTDTITSFHDRTTESAPAVSRTWSLKTWVFWECHWGCARALVAGALDSPPWLDPRDLASSVVYFGV